MRIKTVPEDFVVVELASHAPKEQGTYLLIELTKRNTTTEKALTAIAEYLGTQRRFLGYAGTKDARALTRQYITIKGDAMTVDRLKGFRRDNITLRVLGFVDEPLGLGLLEENRFEIVIRDIADETPTPLSAIPNYFDEQRFSTANAEIGKLLLKSEFLAAAKRIIETDDELASRMRELLEQRPNDAVTALRVVPKNILLLYVHAYQSLLFNEVLSAYIRQQDPAAVKVDGAVTFFVPTKEMENCSVPLFGFGTEHHPTFGSLYETILAREGLEPRDFVVRQLPFLTVEGGERDAFFSVKALSIGPLEDDDINAGKKKQLLSFTLPKGCYATMVVKCLYRTGSILGRD